ncbi:MAG TPA: hypothetical protein VEV39_14950 [Gemmatimonadales bacterium]|nr:hypothetical protein [Gemmatimonadales bacterium]
MASHVTSAPPSLAAALADAMLEGHRYRDAILGDLLEEYGAIEEGSGRGRARWWYWAQAMRLPLGASQSVRLASLAVGVYSGVLVADALQTRFLGVLGLQVPVIAASACLGGYLLARSARGASTAALSLLWGIALAVGVPYILRGWGEGETVYHIAKVGILLAAVTAGSAFRAFAERREQPR